MSRRNINSRVHARGNVEQAFKEMFERPEDSPAGSDEDYPYTRGTAPLFSEAFSEALSTSSPKKSKNAKRKRGKDRYITVVEPIAPKRPTYIMKLYDRGVDMTQFLESAPLYGICRAWMKNHPEASLSAGTLGMSRGEHRPKSVTSDDEAEDQTEKEDSDDIYNLPGPDPLLLQETTQTAPPRVVPTLEDIDRETNSERSSTPSAHLLMSEHAHRWKVARQHCKETARLRQKPYGTSLELLHSVYKDSQAENANSQL